MIKDLVWIKKHYGEDMAKLCRSYLNTLLEEEKLLPTLLKENFQEFRGIAKDIQLEGREIEFKNYMLSKVNVENTNKIITNKTPFQLLEEVGYKTFKCETEEEIQSFKKYYDSKEELCTFRVEKLNRCDVFFAIKNNLDEIKRSDNPTRQDEYGTSVISIQFNKGDINNVSIKNRYNHVVNNPDATFGNNLDNIIEGLTTSFENEYGYNISNSKDIFQFELENYIKGPDNKLYRYIKEIDANYYCVKNAVISGNKVTVYDKEKYVLAENYLIDLQNKNVKDLSLDDTSFKEVFEGTKNIAIENITDENNVKKKKIIFVNEKENNIMILNNRNEIEELKLPQVENIGSNFLLNNENLKNLELSQVKNIGDYFLLNNKKIESIELPQVENIGCEFFCYNKNFKSIKLPQVKNIGNSFLLNNKELGSIELPQVKNIGDYFLLNNKKIESIELPQVENIGYEFLCYNKNLESIKLPQVKNIGSNFLLNNEKLESVELPQVESIKGSFLDNNKNLENIELPQLKSIENRFLVNNKNLKSIKLPQVKNIGDYFLLNNENLESIELPQVRKIGKEILPNNKNFKNLKNKIFKEKSKRDRWI